MNLCRRGYFRRFSEILGRLPVSPFLEEQGVCESHICRHELRTELEHLSNLGGVGVLSAGRPKDVNGFRVIRVFGQYLLRGYLRVFLPAQLDITICERKLHLFEVRIYLKRLRHVRVRLVIVVLVFLPYLIPVKTHERIYFRQARVCLRVIRVGLYSLIVEGYRLVETLGCKFHKRFSSLFIKTRGAPRILCVCRRLGQIECAYGYRQK